MKADSRDFFFSWQPALSVLIKELCDQIEKVAGSCCVISSAEPLCSGTKLGSGLAFPCPWPGGNPEQNLGRKSGLVSRCSLNAWVRQKISFPSWPGEDGAASVSPFWSHLGNILSGQGWGAAGFAFTPEKWKCEKKKSSEAAEPRGKCEYFLASSQQTGAWICRMRKDLGKTLSPKGAGRENAKFLGGFRLWRWVGKQGLHFLAVTWNPNQPPVSCPPARTCWKSHHDFSDSFKPPEQQPQQWWFCPFPFNRGKIPPLGCTQTQDWAYWLHKTTLMYDPCSSQTENFMGNFDILKLFIFWTVQG